MTDCVRVSNLVCNRRGRKSAEGKADSASEVRVTTGCLDVHAGRVLAEVACEARRRSPSYMCFIQFGPKGKE